MGELGQIHPTRKTIPGPSFAMDSPLPCGCRVSREDGSGKLRFWYCPAHAFTFEMLETLRVNLSVLDDVIEHGSSEGFDLTVARAAEIEAGAVIRKARDGILGAERAVEALDPRRWARPARVEPFEVKPTD